MCQGLHDEPRPIEESPELPRSRRRLVPKPEWVNRFEAQIGRRMSPHPNVLSSIKLFVITPMMVLAFKQAPIIPGGPSVIALLLALFFLLDYLDGLVARHHGLDTDFGRFYDRLTDYPLLLIVSWHCVEIIPLTPLLIKLSLDLVLLGQFLKGLGTTENRLRTTISSAALLSLLFISQGWAPDLVSARLVTYLLWTNIVFSLTIILYNFRILQKRFIADTLSMCNLLCGVFSMFFAHLGRVEISIVFLILGAAFDGMDGAAARRFGGTSFGVYSDDLADAVNYGLAPGVALYLVIGGAAGAVVGVAFTAFTWSRLIYFTLNKSLGDPEYFCGAPSTLGGLIVLCALDLFINHQILIGLLVGVACVQMVSFDSHYRHLGRYASMHRKSLFGVALFGLILIAGALLGSKTAAISVVLGACLFYGFLPMFLNFKKLLAARRAAA